MDINSTQPTWLGFIYTWGAGVKSEDKQCLKKMARRK